MASTEENPARDLISDGRLGAGVAAPAWPPTLIGALLGVVLFLAIGALPTLDFSRVGWLFDTPDPSTHYLGWSFFRHDAWRWPLGMNPNYGMEMGSSIVYSDSIPLMALLFKPLARWMGADFQYTGVWILLCLVLQGIFAMLLMRRLTPHRLLQVLGAGFLVIPVVLLKRLEGHYALLAQWVVLWAIYLHLRGRSTPAKATGAWTIVVALAALIHLYLAAMVIAIWLADAVRAWLAGRPQARVVAMECAAVLGTMLLMMWLAGYFGIGFGDSRTPGVIGAYSMNLLSLLDSRGYSRFLPAFPLHRSGQDEGTAYLGLGMILLAGIAAFRRPTNRQPRLLSTSLLVVCTIIVIFALSPIITLGQWRLLQLPNYWGFVGEIFRASGRVIWPAYYVLLLIVLAATLRRFPARTAGWILAATLTAQVADLSPAITRLPEHFAAEPPLLTPLKDPFWAAAGAKYKRLLLVRPDGANVDWLALGRFATKHRMAINYGYFARTNWYVKEAANQKRLDALQQGAPDPEALYIICDGKVMDGLRQSLPSDAWAGQVDGMQVIAPRWQ